MTFFTKAFITQKLFEAGIRNSNTLDKDCHINTWYKFQASKCHRSRVIKFPKALPELYRKKPPKNMKNGFFHINAINSKTMGDIVLKF